MTYLSKMQDGRKIFYQELREALEVYFNANASSFGRSESDTLMVIIEDHVEHYFPDVQSSYQGNASMSHPGITMVEGEGLNVAYSYGDALQSELFQSLDMQGRVELLEACIYALNRRLNDLDRSGEDQEGG